MPSELSQLIEQLRDEVMADPDSPASPLLTRAAIELQKLAEEVDLDKVDRVATAVRRAIHEAITEAWGWQPMFNPMYISNDGFRFEAETAHETWQVRCDRQVHARPVSNG